MPNVNDLLQKGSSAHWFSKVDMNKMFHQIPCSDSTWPKGNPTLIKPQPQISPNLHIQ